MPTNHDNNKREHKPAKPISNRAKSSPVVNLSVNTGIEQITNIETQPQESNSDNSQIKINIANQPGDYTHDIAANKIATEANRIAKRSFWVNTGLFIGTLIVIGLSIWQSHLATVSVGLADSVFKATKFFNDSSLKIQQNAYVKSVNDGVAQGILNDSNSKRQERSVNAQIASLQETQKEFEIESRPFLIVSEISITNIDVGKKPIIANKLYNRGKHPAYIIDAFSDYSIRPDTDYCSINNINHTPNIVHMYLTNIDNIPMGGAWPDTLTKQDGKSISSQKLYMYMRYKFIYRGLYKSKNYKMTLVYRIRIGDNALKVMYYKID